MTEQPPSHLSVPVVAWRGDGATRGSRSIPEETAIALTYGRMTHAVMMATPADLTDFAVGFSLAERIIASPAEIEELEVVAGEQGIELRMSVAGGRMDALLHRRRVLTGATGCGLCGMESLEEAARPPPIVRSTLRVSARALAAAPMALAERQSLNAATHAVHAAGFWTETDGITLAREDVGRHNALDKLAGALACRGADASQGVVVLTSRVSVEMVQKAAMIGSPVIMAVSAPTALALRVATEAGITLIGVARGDGFEVFTHPDRIVLEAPVHVGCTSGNDGEPDWPVLRPSRRTCAGVDRGPYPAILGPTDARRHAGAFRRERRGPRSAAPRGAGAARGGPGHAGSGVPRPAMITRAP